MLNSVLEHQLPAAQAAEILGVSERHTYFLGPDQPASHQQGGHRQANAALHRIVIVRLRHDERTRAYMRRPTSEGMSKAEFIHCLKRYVACEIFSTIRNTDHIAQTTP